MARSDSLSIPLQTPGHLKELFDRVDQDKDGYVCYRELYEFLQSNEEGIPRHVIRRIHENADRNDDGKLDCQEFIHMVMDPENKYIFGQYFNMYMRYLLPPSIHQSGLKSSTSIDVADGRYEERYSCWPPKVCMILISLIEIVFFTVDAVQGNTMARGPMATAHIYNPHRRQEAWRFFTYMFVHVGLLHLLVNLFVQLLLGVPLEMVHKWWRVLIVYLAGVIAGSLGTSVTDPSVWLAGASGGVYALITAHIASIIMNWKDMTYPLAQLAIFVVVICTDVGTAIYNRYVGDKNDEHIGYAAHFFGALAGLLIGITVLKNISVEKHERVLKMIAYSLYLILMSAAISVHIFNPARFPEPDKR
ncbi:rhomboid-related protein 2 [Onthophagus taurus]|uniref:rhomboid-related protein 2 n=1 Tax=Onthophagus taurus TaxID=166361 RepID=UPI000C20E1EF|nr:rhomboid-related protein 2 [Onthophagus taurus]